MNEKDAINEAVKFLKEGGVILCPTDTIYGLSCDASNAEAVERIRQIKGRDGSKSFIVLVNNDRMVNQCFKDVPGVAWDMIDLADSPLTLVMEEGRGVAENVLNQDGSLGMRMVKKGAINEILKRFNKPIVSTSPNISGEPTPVEFEQIDKRISEAVDYSFPPQENMEMSGLPSKIIRIKQNGELTILRK